MREIGVKRMDGKQIAPENKDLIRKEISLSLSLYIYIYI
jgi:hypothetical protein